MGQTKRIYEQHQDLSELGLFDDMIDMDYQYQMWKEKQIQQYEEYLMEQEERGDNN